MFIEHLFPIANFDLENYPDLISNCNLNPDFHFILIVSGT